MNIKYIKLHINIFSIIHSHIFVYLLSFSLVSSLINYSLNFLKTLPKLYNIEVYYSSLLIENNEEENTRMIILCY